MKSDKEKEASLGSRRSFFKRLSLLPTAWAMGRYLQSSAYAHFQPEPARLSPTMNRPAWLREGIVGSWHMEALEFYIRRGYSSVTVGGPAHLDQLWKEAFKEETVSHYMEMGINLVIMPLHKGARLKAETQSIQATRKFTENAHRYGVRVGGYVGSTMMYETFYSEEPDARNWEQVDERGRPIYYYDQTFRHVGCRNNPGYRAFIQKVLRLGSFFRSHIKDLIDTTPVADVAILRSFASIEFNPAKSIVSTVLFEQTLIQRKLPFGIIFDTHLKDLGNYKVLVLANQDALSDEQIGQIRRFVEAGGGLVATEETSMLTEWRRKRDKFGLADVLGLEAPPAAEMARNPLRREFGKGRVAYIPRIEPQVAPPAALMDYNFSNEYWKLPKNHEELVEAVRWAARGQFSASVDAPLWVTMELAEQKSTKTWLLHLLNFRIEAPLRDIPVEVRIPDGIRLREAILESPDGLHSQALDFSGRQGVVRFSVPKLSIYNVITLRPERE
jgi:hypothetical protein